AAEKKIRQIDVREHGARLRAAAIVTTLPAVRRIGVVAVARIPVALAAAHSAGANVGALPVLVARHRLPTRFLVGAARGIASAAAVIGSATSDAFFLPTVAALAKRAFAAVAATGNAGVFAAHLAGGAALGRVAASLTGEVRIAILIGRALVAVVAA